MDTPTQSHGNGSEGANRPAGEAAARGETEDMGMLPWKRNNSKNS